MNASDDDFGWFSPADFEIVLKAIAKSLLALARDKLEHRFRDTVEQLASQFSLTDDERGAMLPSGTAPVLDNRVIPFKRPKKGR